MVTYLLKAGAAVNTRNAQGESALILLAKDKELSDYTFFHILVTLVQAGADATLKDNSGHNASYYMREFGHCKKQGIVFVNVGGSVNAKQFLDSICNNTQSGGHKHATYIAA